MKRQTKILMASIFGILSTLFGGCKKAEPKQAEYKPADIYVGLRNQALKLTAEQLQFSPTAENPKVLAVLMETGYPEAVATLVSIADGAASLYFSNGGGIIGAGENGAPKVASKELVRTAEQFVKDCKLTAEFPLPKKSFTRFFLVTIDGVFTTEVLEDDLGNNRHKLSPLFYKAQDLITIIRLTEDQKRKGGNK
jgi:hypothetical protein